MSIYGTGGPPTDASSAGTADLSSYAQKSLLPVAYGTAFEGTQSHSVDSWVEITGLRLDFPSTLTDARLAAVINVSVSFSSIAQHLNAAFRLRKLVNGTLDNVQTPAHEGSRPGVNFSDQPEPDVAETLSTISYCVCDVLDVGTSGLRVEVRATDSDQITINRLNGYNYFSWSHRATSTVSAIILSSGVISQTPPPLPSAALQEGGTVEGQSYRMQQITLIRTRLAKKYRRGVNAVDGINTALLTISMATGIGGVGLLSTVIAAPVVLGFEATALACGAAGIAGKIISRKLAVKERKHGKIAHLAEAKLNTIAGRVSSALVDGSISDGEFHLILDELTKFQEMREEVRRGSRKAYRNIQLDELDAKAKNRLIQQGRDEARKSFITKLGAS